MRRVAILGNAGGGKSTLARLLTTRHDLPYHEVDKLVWLPSWRLRPEAEYAALHDAIIAGECWLMDGIGRREFIAPRLARASEIILVDMPFEVHRRLVLQRHAAWQAGTLDHPPGDHADAPPLDAVLAMMKEIDQDWMPEIRRLVAAEEAAGKSVWRIAGPEELTSLQKSLQE
ncbi:MAG: adenylate kinase [Alphaproteobacteria bacterium]